MAHNEVKSELRGAVLIVTFNRPDRGNALTPDVANQLFNILKPATTDRGIRAVVLQGEGGNFMDGLDMKLFAGDFNTALEHYNQMFQPYHSAIRELYVMDKPVIAACDGTTSGPGFSIMMACDFVLAARGAKFNTKYASYAMTPDGGCSFALARKAGAGKAMELLMLSETFGAAEGEKCNLVNAVTEDGKVHEEATKWAERLANGPTRAYAGIKKLVGKAFEQDINTHLALEHSYWGASSRSFDFREALRAMTANRAVRFTGT